MTERLYYLEPYRTRFTARVVEWLTWQDRPAVILDRTAFYPTSGGQPADRGTLGDAAVLDVVERASDSPAPAPVVHILSRAVATDQVMGEIDWQRRFDHMQQHTGQHILSAAFEHVLGAATVGFHLGAESSTIDVDLSGLQMEDVLPIEAAANEVVWDDRPLTTRVVDRDEMAAMSMAEPPPDVEGPIRLVEIPGPSPSAAAASSTTTGAELPFDVNPCGGTHVTCTGEIGLIKLVGLEHRGDKTRIEFLCGRRTLSDYEAKRRMTDTLANMLTVGSWELDEAVDRLQEENKQLRHDQRELRERLLDMESIQLMRAAHRYGPYRVVGAVCEQRSPDELRTLARKLAEHRGVVALLFSAPAVSPSSAPVVDVSNSSDRVHFCFARAESLDLDVNQLLQAACAQLGGKGGGRPQVAQGSAPGAPMDKVERVLRDLKATLEQDP